MTTKKNSQCKDLKDQARKDGNFLSKSFKVDLVSYMKIQLNGRLEDIAEFLATFQAMIDRIIKFVYQ